MNGARYQPNACPTARSDPAGSGPANTGSSSSESPANRGRSGSEPPSPDSPPLGFASRGSPVRGRHAPSLETLNKPFPRLERWGTDAPSSREQPPSQIWSDLPRAERGVDRVADVVEAAGVVELVHARAREGGGAFDWGESDDPRRTGRELRGLPACRKMPPRVDADPRGGAIRGIRRRSQVSLGGGGGRVRRIILTHTPP